MIIWMQSLCLLSLSPRPHPTRKLKYFIQLLTDYHQILQGINLWQSSLWFLGWDKLWICIILCKYFVMRSRNSGKIVHQRFFLICHFQKPAKGSLFWAIFVAKISFIILSRGLQIPGADTFGSVTNEYFAILHIGWMCEWTYIFGAGSPLHCWPRAPICVSEWCVWRDYVTGGLL